MRSRLSLLMIAAAAAVVLAVAPRASAQVAVSGTFGGPHGAVSFSTGVPLPFVAVAHHDYRGRGYGYYGRGDYGRGYGYYGRRPYVRHYDYYPRYNYYRPYVRRWVRPYYYGPSVVVRPYGYGYGGYYDYDDDCD